MKIKAIFIAVAATAPLLVLLPASAVSGTCSARMEEREIVGPNEYRVRAWCSSLARNTKARGELVRTGPIINRYTIWFTDDSGRSYYSGWYDAGSYATYELAPVG